MQRKLISVILFVLLVCIPAACGPGGEKAVEDSEAVQEENTPQDTVAEEPFDLMSYSALDTNSGVFFGDYDEKVNDEITVKVGLEVTLLEGRITDIKLLDTTWVHPRAALLVPQRIIEQQKLPVDAVSGASVASWSIMTATAIALEVDLTVLEDEEWQDPMEEEDSTDN